MICMTKECLGEYQQKLESSIAEYMKAPLSIRSMEAVNGMISCWQMVASMKQMLEGKSDKPFSRECATEWNSKMLNADGTVGGHWTIDETNGVGLPGGVDDYVWNVVMNMMYSDYGEVAMRYGVSSAEFFSDLAKAFLYDRDAKEPLTKVSEYYHHIVK